MRSSTLAIVLVAATGLVTSTAGALAAKAPPPRVSGRVRVTPSGPRTERMIGTIVRSDADSLLLALEGPSGPAPRRLAWDGVDRVEIWRVRHPATARGARIGAGAGGVIGLMVGLYVKVEEPAEEQGLGIDIDFGPRMAAVIQGIAYCGAAGALLGAIIGSTVRVGNWQSLWHQGRPRWEDEFAARAAMTPPRGPVVGISLAL